jgi:NAD(P)H-dependent FMN reductase
MPNLMIIVASTRPGRVGLPMAEWVRNVTLEHGRFEGLDFADLAEIDLPFLDEPHHPRLQQYTHQHTRDWSARVTRADAFVMVTPEYNYGMPAPLKNAIDYLHYEWAYKPVAFVSYGGVAAGTRSVQMTKLVVTTLRMFAIFEAVYVPFVRQLIGANGEVQPNEVMETAAVAMLDELLRVAAALRPLRDER